MGKKKEFPAQSAAQVGGLNLESMSLNQFQGLVNILLTHGYGPAVAPETFQDIGAAKELDLDLFRGDAPGLKLLQHPIKGAVDKSKALFLMIVAREKSVTDCPQPLALVEENQRYAGTQGGRYHRWLFAQI